MWSNSDRVRNEAAPRSREDLRSLFIAHLPTIDRILISLGRRHGIVGDALEDFASWAKLRLIENDYAILAKFRGESTLSTYLAVVLAMLLREHRVREWGRWRASAAAKRSGPLGVRLETLLYRDGVPLAVAGEIVRGTGETSLADTELAAIVSKFPRRVPVRHVCHEKAAVEIEAIERADDPITAAESAAERATVRVALRTAMELLSPDDRLIVRLNCVESMTVADIARALGLPQKPLYRRLKTAIRALRTTMEHRGISREAIRAWVCQAE